jgi:hypothetical protein
MGRPSDDQLDEEVCFVYKVISPCALRCQPNISDDDRIPDSKYVFQTGDLVSVDLIKDTERASEHSTNGPFLRLSDGSGWLFEHKHSEPMMERMKVEAGLWCFYADNFPAGIGLRTHPIDDLALLVDPGVTFFPMEKLVCDKKVTDESGVNFYRLQGSSGWVFDKRGNKAMLLNEEMVKTGLFSYKALYDISIRKKADVGNDKGISNIVKKGDIVSVDIIRHSPYANGNGPFLRLSDGSGWLFENKFNEKLMEPMSIDEGSWSLKVVSNVGIALRSQPTCRNFQTTTIYLKGSVCNCDQRISSPSGTTFYRVKGTNGWVFDKTNDNIDLMTAVTSGIFSSSSPMSVKNPMWPFSAKSPDAVVNVDDNIHDQNRTPGIRTSIRLSLRGDRISSPSASSIESSLTTITTTTQDHIKRIQKEKEFVDKKLKALRGEQD